jgi:hypothetical protein
MIGVAQEYQLRESGIAFRRYVVGHGGRLPHNERNVISATDNSFARRLLQDTHDSNVSAPLLELTNRAIWGGHVIGDRHIA